MVKEMAKILGCDVMDCSYNKHNACHTMAITVGGAADACPMCDTYVHSSLKGGILDMQGGVGACKVEGCTFNDALECSAGSIKVGKHNGHPDCKTFAPR